MDSDSDSSESQKRPRRSFTLKVAMKFPAKKATPKKPARPHKNRESDSEGEDNFAAKRALNIKENKAMVRTHMHTQKVQCCLELLA